MASYRYPQPAGSEITPRETYFGRRALLAAGAGMVAGLAAPWSAEAAPLKGKPSPLSTNETQTPLGDVTSYNNFYEFGQDKEDPARLASSFHPRPWTLTIGGAVGKPKTWDIDALLKRDDLEERIYRMRCVEAWSMVIPWIGLPLGTLLREAEPASSARYVAFESVLRPDELPGQREAFSLEWPYVEGLRLDEAMHPLALLAVGLYGETLPNQNGAPIRLVTPWKYGFKGIKSITKITLTDKQPETSWSRMAPSEYGFYANVNPAVDHPRWSQASERVIGKASLFGAARKPTLPFNGYGEQVASLYQGMDLRKFY